MRKHITLVVFVVIAGLMVAGSIVQSRAGDFAAFYWSGWCVTNDELDLLYDNQATNSIAPTWTDYHEHSVPWFTYLPPFAYLMAPLAHLPYPAARALWLVVRVLMLIICTLYWMRQAFGRRPELVFLASSIMLVAGPVVHGQGWGQSNVLLLAILTLVTVALQRGVDFLSGILWGLAVIVKPFALVFGLHMWRRPKAALWAVLTVLILVLVSGPWLVVDYLGALVAPVQANLRGLPWNVSLWGFLRTHADDNAAFLYPVLALLGLSLTVFALRGLTDPHERVGLSVASGLLLWPAVQVHYLVFAVVPIAVIMRWARQPEGPRYLWAPIAVSALALAVTPYQVYLDLWPGLAFYALVLLWLTTVVHSFIVQKQHSQKRPKPRDPLEVLAGQLED